MWFEKDRSPCGTRTSSCAHTEQSTAAWNERVGSGASARVTHRSSVIQCSSRSTGALAVAVCAVIGAAALWSSASAASTTKSTPPSRPSSKQPARQPGTTGPLTHTVQEWERYVAFGRPMGFTPEQWFALRLNGAAGRGLAG